MLDKPTRYAIEGCPATKRTRLWFSRRYGTRFGMSSASNVRAVVGRERPPPLASLFLLPWRFDLEAKPFKDLQ
jgi:hypothetical protein